MIRIRKMTCVLVHAITPDSNLTVIAPVVVSLVPHTKPIDEYTTSTAWLIRDEKLNDVIDFSGMWTSGIKNSLCCHALCFRNCKRSLRYKTALETNSIRANRMSIDETNCHGRNEDSLLVIHTLDLIRCLTQLSCTHQICRFHVARQRTISGTVNRAKLVWFHAIMRINGVFVVQAFNLSVLCVW